MMKVTVNTANSNLELFLGKLEALVLQVIWFRDLHTIGTIHKAVRETNDVAFTTVATVVNRLVTKGILIRKSKPKQYRSEANEYHAVYQYDEFISASICRTLLSFVKDYPDHYVAMQEALKEIATNDRTTIPDPRTNSADERSVDRVLTIAGADQH